MNNRLPSCEELIRQHSKARVLTPSRRVSITGFSPITGLPSFSRQMTDADALEAQVRKYR